MKLSELQRMTTKLEKQITTLAERLQVIEIASKDLSTAVIQHIAEANPNVKLHEQVCSNKNGR